jgi:cyclopropane fatty-acyl-phospholipid synthase-like methyltransferase
VLDFGCGSGRDTKYFIEAGFEVVATDGSEELCKSASEYTGITVKQMLFQELDETASYDGIWACSSILHLPKKELEAVFTKMIRALCNDGIIYTSFKYGTFEGERNGRFFTDFTLETFEEFVKCIENISIEDYWITGDVRPGREEEQWLNLILRKTNL